MPETETRISYSLTELAEVFDLLRVEPKLPDDLTALELRTMVLAQRLAMNTARQILDPQGNVSLAIAGRSK
jgi:hypothetical protein